MRDKQYREFEIRRLFFILRGHYLKVGMGIKEAEERTYDDLGIRFGLKKTTIRHARDLGAKGNIRENLYFEFKNRLKRLKEIIEIAEKEIE